MSIDMIYENYQTKFLQQFLMSQLKKSEQVLDSSDLNEGGEKALIVTRFAFNSSPEIELLLQLWVGFIVVRGQFPTTLVPSPIIPLTPELAYRITIHQSNLSSNSAWLLELVLPQGRMKVQSSESEHLAMWNSHLRRKIFKFGFWDDFKPVRRISKGLSSAVYQVTRAADKKNFAVKAFSKSTLEENPDIARALENQIALLREITELKHKHLLGIEEVYTSDSSLYIVMELCGKDLVRGFCMAAGCVEYKVREAMRQVLFGLEALHATGVVHRDIKPNNIMFKQSESLELVITDFGLSTQLDSDHPFNRCGTPGFIAPEVFKLVEKEKLKNHACDIFSIGAVFHLLLTGQPLFHASSPKDLFVKNSKMDFDFSHEKYTNLSHQGLHLMKQMLEADPQARITAKEALQHEFFHDEAKLRSPVPTFQSSNQLACNNEQEFSEIDLGTTGRKRLKGEYRKASQL